MKQSQAYFICATPRSGTTLLTDLLTDTRVAGQPDSFFRMASMRSYWAAELRVSVDGWEGDVGFDQAFLNAVLHQGTANTQLFGMRVMWRDFPNLLQRLRVLFPDLASDKARIQAAFGPTQYIHLSRQDKVAQAISRIKAEQSGLWHLHADGTERERVKPNQEPVYDPQVLAEQVAEYEQHEAAWVSWFGGQAIEPMRITYEALSASPQTTLAKVLSALSVDSSIAETVHPRTTKLANDESHEWANRFRHDNK
ncbi:MAG: Stf0 family sulfotransferase [Chloroflexota bacterium]